MIPAEVALRFPGAGADLVGVITLPARRARRGIVVVTGGPQYRVGSHRQFVLLARAWAGDGVPVMRFDRTGMGDSAGERSGATAAADIGAALDAFQATVPGLEEIVLWGLCSAGTLAACYAPRDQRVRGVVMVNPWTEAARGRAAAHLRHYYVTRLASRALWRRACTGRVDFGRSLRGLARTIAACGRGPAADAAPPIGGVADGEFTLMPSELLASLQAFSGRSLLILCGGDEEALVFRSNVVATAAWRRLEARALATRRELPEANHTFSRRDWRDQVGRWTGEWLRTW